MGSLCRFEIDAKDRKKRQDFVEQIEAMADKEAQPEFKPAS